MNSFSFKISLIVILTIKNLVAGKFDPDEIRNASELIRSKGFPCEEHDVITEDGYILSIQRIPFSRFQSSYTPRPIVYLQHGLLDASSTWVINYPDQSLAFILADNGFDVWLGNMRGNTYGRRHINLDPKTEDFWDFNWDQMAKYDLPAIINYALKYTGQSELIYIGHSQGTLIGFAEFSQNEEIASKVKLFVALAPIGTVGYIESPLKYFAGPTPAADDLYYALFGKKGFLPSGRIFRWLSDKVCTRKLFVKEFCENLMFVISGPSRYLNASRIPVISSHDPAGTSVKNMLHYTQTEPPLYDFSKIKVPIAFIWSGKDWLADPDDVQYLRSILTTIIYEKYIDDWDHLDFLLAINAPEWLYYDILDLLKKN